uniref:(northern house mosquito) hypothetical protein n=1 Tax=Culex pipiens TaxID=7175 RepID=A0A8D8ALH0_CULPI
MTGAADHASGSIRRPSKRSCVERGPGTVRTNGIRPRRPRLGRFAVTTTVKIVLVTSVIVEVDTITAVTNTRMILRRDVITWNGIGAVIVNLHRGTLIAVGHRRKIEERGTAEIITVHRSTATVLRTIRNRTSRDRPATGRTSHAGRKRTAGSTTKIVPTGSTAINAHRRNSGNTTITPEDTPTTTAEDVRVAGKVPTRTRARATGTANPRKTWTLAGHDTSWPADSATFPIVAACSVGTRTRDRPPCITTIARWTVAVATWTGEAAADASDHPTGTASTVLSKIWPTSRCNTNTNIIIRTDRIKVLRCSINLAAACHLPTPTHNP